MSYNDKDLPSPKWGHQIQPPNSIFPSLVNSYPAPNGHSAHVQKPGCILTRKSNSSQGSSITNRTAFSLQSRTWSEPITRLDGVYTDPSKHTCYEATREYRLPDSADVRPTTSCSFRVKSGETPETPEIFLDNPGSCFY